MLNNNDIKEVFNEVYNKWFSRWRDADLTEQKTWDEICATARELSRKYPFPLTDDLIATLYSELDRRARWKRGNA